MRHFLFLKKLAVLVVLASMTFSLAQLPVSGRAVTAIGTGTVFGEPDAAQFEVGVDVVHEDLSEAYRQANESINHLLNTLTEAGVNPEDIRTIAFNIWSDNRVGPEATEVAPVFHVIHMLLVTVRDVEHVAELLSTSIEAGANTIGSVQHTLQNPQDLENSARELAVAEAQERARRLAELTRVALGNVIAVEEFSDAAALPHAAYGGPSEGAAGAPVQGGQLAVSITVRVSFAIE